MKNFFKSGALFILSFTACIHSRNKDNAFFDGNTLFDTVEKYVSFGEHRTATPADSATVEWLSAELRSHGYEINYTRFSFRQFFPEEVSVTTMENNHSFQAFPLWYLNEKITLNPEGILTSDTTAEKVRDKIVLLNFSFGQSGKSAANIQNKIKSLAQAGARAVIGYKENKSGENVAFNVPVSADPWGIPVVIISPIDAGELAGQEGLPVKIIMNGRFKNVTARNVYGSIGKGERYVVISTPISGWFRCGGERGPGVAIWLALAKWAASQKLPYTFVFTANSGHEMDFWGAHEFLEHDAPTPDKTLLWIHLGAGIATLSWKETPEGLVKENKVDAGRNFYYSSSVKTAFDTAFIGIPGNKWNTQEQNGGELLAVNQKGYPNILGVSHAHAFFHTPSDDAGKTSPEILQEAAIAFRNFLNEYLK